MENIDKLKITYTDINALKFAEYNPRKATDKEYNDLKDSLKKFGFIDPILVNSNKDRENVIIGGHFRVTVAKKLGIIKVPVVYIDLPLGKERELNLRLNKNVGEWDWSLLSNLEEELLREVGFDNQDLKKLLGTDSEIEGDEEFTTEVLEENNYLVFTFDNVMDWNFIKERLGIKSVAALDSKKGYERKGVGRVLNGKRLIDLLNNDS